jgi:hypothetical protein
MFYKSEYILENCWAGKPVLGYSDHLACSYRDSLIGFVRSPLIPYPVIDAPATLLRKAGIDNDLHKNHTPRRDKIGNGIHVR